MKQLNFIIFIIFIFSCSIFAQDKKSDVTEAQKILAKAKIAVSKGRQIEEIKGFSLSSIVKSHLSLDYHGKTGEIDEDTKYENNFEFQNLKIKRKESTNRTTLFNKIVESTGLEEESILNNNNYFNHRSDFVDGQKVIVPTLPSTKEESIFYLKVNSFPTFFPITLNSWYLPLEFHYVGIAESKEGRANVIEAKAEKQNTYRLFFDEKTNLLLLLIKTFVDDKNRQSEEKYYYSDYKEMDGLLVATTIKSEKTQPNGKIIEKREIKDLKINPAFKADFFK